MGAVDIVRPRHSRHPWPWPHRISSTITCDSLLFKRWWRGYDLKKKKNQWLSADEGSYAVNVLLGSQILPFSTALAWCPGVIYSAVTWWSLHHGRELNKNAIKEDKINLLTVLFNKNSWRIGRQAHQQSTSSAKGWLRTLTQASSPGRGPS